MACRVGVRPQRLVRIVAAVVKQPTAELQHPRVLLIELVGVSDRQVQMQLLGYAGARPGRRHVVRALLKCQRPAAVGVGQHQPVRRALGHARLIATAVLQTEQLAVELSERASIRTVDDRVQQARELTHLPSMTPRRRFRATLRHESMPCPQISLRLSPRDEVAAGRARQARTMQTTAQRHGTFVGARNLIAGVLVAAALAFIAWQGNANALTMLGYLPMIVAGFFGYGLDIGGAQLREMVAALGSIAIPLVLAALGYAVLPRKPIFGRLTTDGVRRLLSRSVRVAIVIPIGYAITRIAWVLGIPLGISAEFLEQIDGIVMNGAVLAAGAIGGAVLTWGLTRPWGTTFPRWVPRLRGRRVPIGLARNSAVFVGTTVLSAGAYFIRSMVTGNISIAPAGAELQIAAWLPEMFWPVWGIALIVAGLAYAELRRRTEALVAEMIPA